MQLIILKDLVLLFGLALLTVTLFRYLKVPSIIGFLCTGLLAGPYALGLITDTHQVEQMAEIGVVLLLFTIGIEFSLKELLRIRQLVLWGGGVQVGVTIAAITALALIFSFTWQQSVFFGFLVSLSSTAILMKLLMDAGQMDTPQGKIALGILIFQDLCVVPLMLFTPFLGGAGDGLRGILMVCAKAVIVVLVAHMSARFAVPWLFTQIVRTRSRELFVLTIIFVGFGTAFVTAQVGLSLALGAFIAGLAISESEYSHQVMGDIIPFRDAFMSLFFISVGMLLDPRVFLTNPLTVILIVVGIILIKGAVATAAALILRFPIRPAIMSGFMLAQVGEFAFVLSHAGLSVQLLTDSQYQVFLAASVATMAITPVLLAISPTFAEWVAGRLPVTIDRETRTTGQSKDRFSLHDHVVIVGYGVNGKNLAQVLTTNGIGYIAVETNHMTVKRERKLGTRIIFGDASRQEILHHAHIMEARMLVVAISDAAATRRVVAQARQMKPMIHIIVRTRYVSEMEPLYQLGVNDVIPEEFETSVEIFARVLKTYLIPNDDIEACIADVRRDSYHMFRSFSKNQNHSNSLSGYLSGVELATYRVMPGSAISETRLGDGAIRAVSRATVLMIKRQDQQITNPGPEEVLHVGDVVLFMGELKDITAAGRLFS